MFSGLKSSSGIHKQCPSSQLSSARVQSRIHTRNANVGQRLVHGNCFIGKMLPTRLAELAEQNVNAIQRHSRPSTGTFYKSIRDRAILSPHLNIPTAAIEQLFSKGDRESFATILRYEVDDKLHDRLSSVELKYFAGSNSIRILKHKSYDLLEGKKLVGWKRDHNGHLVAVLKTVVEQHEQASAGPGSWQLQLQQQLKGFRVVSAQRRRSFVLTRPRIINDAIYAPFGVWKELFDGSNRPFPTDGVPIRLMVNGAVQVAEQHVRLVRRIGPYGYYMIRGIKGLHKLRGKLLVRWSLLVSGAVEVEVCDKPAEVGGAACAGDAA